MYPRPFLIPDGNPYADEPDYFVAHDRTQHVTAGRTMARQATALLGRTGRLLEIGCGRGDGLRGARAEGWDVRGVEMTRAFADEADSDTPIELARAEDAKSLTETWDAILLPAILEHVYDPGALIDRVREALVPGGVMFIEVPNECGLWATAGRLRHLARGWSVNLSPTFPPFHVVGFCPRSLPRLLTTRGFVVEDMIPYRFTPSGLGRLERAVFALGHRIGKGGGIGCWARKTAHSGRAAR